MEQQNQDQKNSPQKQSDWSIGELYNSAVTLVKKNKVLWLFAAALGATGSFSYNQSSNLSGKDLQNFQKLFQNSPQTSHKVLGASTNILSDTIKYLFSAVHPAWYVLIGLEFFFLFIVGIIISLVYRGWAEAGLLESIENAIHLRPVTIKDASEKAFGEIKSILWIRWIPTLIFFGGALLAIILTSIIGFLLGPPVVIILFILEFIVFVIFIIMISFSQIWAVREIVVDKKPGKEAFFAGLSIVKKKFWPMMGLGFLNVILVGVMTGILFIPVIAFFIGGIAAFVFVIIFKNTVLLSILILISVLLLLSAGAYFQLAKGILEAFSTSVWSLAYNKIRGKYDK